MLERDGRFYIVYSRRIGGKLQLGQNGIDHVLFSFEQVSQENLVLNELRRFTRQIRLAARKELFKPLARFRPIFFEKRNFRQVEARIPELRIDPSRLEQGCLRFVVDALPHQDHAAQILRWRELGLAGIDRVEFL